MGEILTPVVVLSAMGIVIAVLLGVISKLTYVPVDPKIAQIEEALPGINCGACGYPGCSGCAAAIANEEAPVNACVVGGDDTAAVVADIMGKTASGGEKYVASVKCQGDCDHTRELFEYDGVSSCTVMTYTFGGNKSCNYGCVGCGDCYDVCDFDAIRIVNGVAVIDKDKCTQCMKCIEVCPKKIIELVPYSAPAQVKCKNPEMGKAVSKNCTIGCIGCTLCAKLAPNEFAMDGKLAHATYHPDYDIEKAKAAAAKCPAKCIVMNEQFAEPVLTEDKEAVEA